MVRKLERTCLRPSYARDGAVRLRVPGRAVPDIRETSAWPRGIANHAVEEREGVASAVCHPD
jgi:hypothetical protein